MLCRRFNALFLLASICLLLSTALFADVNDKIYGNIKVSKPYKHKNVTLYLLHGKDKLQNKEFVTLSEAMKSKIVKVHETGNVNELVIENKSKDKEIYIQSGEIVKGGKQDRLLSDDIVIAPGKKVKSGSFCVEHGRWQKRGSESASEFGSSNYSIPGNDLKIAVRKEKNQSAVWEKVSKYQDKVSENLGVSVRGAQSPSSLQLSLENKDLKKKTEDYVGSFKNVINDKSDAIGYLFVVNGKIISSDIYCSNSLFNKMWEKNLHSLAMEASSTEDSSASSKQPTLLEIEKFIISAQSIKPEKSKSGRMSYINAESDEVINFETEDHNYKVILHRNTIKK